MGHILRFAPLIRVSTEKQEQQGESLKTQKEAIKKAVDILNGCIPEDCWKYSGQEHATPDFERKLFSQLLADAKNKKFDAVIVYDPSRWSRDNRKSKEGLSVLRGSGIKFYVGTTEYDLFEPQACLFLGMSAEMNEYFSLEQSRKSILSRIARAKSNRPSTGKIPFGRSYNKKTGEWSVIIEDKEKIKWAAEQYLNGVSMEKIAKTLNMSHANLWKILRHRSGKEWTVEFNDARLNIKESITLNIPNLLDDDVIELIKTKSDNNKTFEHGCIKNKYILSRMIFCDKCGRALFGQTNHNGRRYYRHGKKVDVNCNELLYINADIIEEAVVVNLFSLSGDEKKIKESIVNSLNKYNDLSNIKKENDILKNELKKINRKKSNLIDAVSNGLLSNEDIKIKIDYINTNIKIIEDKIHLNDEKIKFIPNEKDIKRRCEFVSNVIMHIAKSRYKRAEHYLRMEWENKRKLCETFFSGIDLDGNRSGVYISKNEEGDIQFEIRSLINTPISGKIPLSDYDFIELLQVDPDDQKLEQDLLSKRHAYHCLGLHQ